MGYMIWNLYRKITTAQRERLFYEKWVEEFAMRVEQVNAGLKVVDVRGSFEADDEVGFAFKEIKELVYLLAHMNSLLNIDEIMEKYRRGERYAPHPGAKIY
jgi:hypothetical protein